MKRAYLRLCPEKLRKKNSLSKVLRIFSLVNRFVQVYCGRHLLSDSASQMHGTKHLSVNPLWTEFFFSSFFGT